MFSRRRSGPPTTRSCWPATTTRDQPAWRHRTDDRQPPRWSHVQQRGTQRWGPVGRVRHTRRPYYAPMAVVFTRSVRRLEQFSGSTFSPAISLRSFQAAGINATAYAARLSGGQTSVIVLNKDMENDLALRLDFGAAKSGSRGDRDAACAVRPEPRSSHHPSGEIRPTREREIHRARSPSFRPPPFSCGVRSSTKCSTKTASTSAVNWQSMPSKPNLLKPPDAGDTTFAFPNWEASALKWLTNKQSILEPRLR